jgi:hypothetical protein
MRMTVRRMTPSTSVAEIGVVESVLEAETVIE